MQVQSSYNVNPTTQTALQIPELLLNIFYYVSPSDLTRLACVCLAFTPPARTTLYREIRLTWRFTEVEPLLRAFEANPNLSHEVRSSNITGFGYGDLLEDLQQILQASGVVKTLVVETGLDEDDDDYEEVYEDLFEKKWEAMIAESADTMWVSETAKCLLADLFLLDFIRGHQSSSFIPPSTLHLDAASVRLNFLLEGSSSCDWPSPDFNVRRSGRRSVGARLLQNAKSTNLAH